MSARTLIGLALGVTAFACGGPEGGEPMGSAPASGSSQEEAAAAAASPPRLALWIPCEGTLRVLDDPARGEQLVADARALGATDLFVQVYRGGRAWFDSSLADATPYQALRERSGQDPLGQLLVRAHSAGLRVHAWVNLLSLASNRDAPLLRELGSEVVQVDRRGRSVLEYPGLDVPAPDRSYYRMGTPQVWLDPAEPRLAERLAETFAELIVRYPELDGLHYDYIRYPDVLPFSPGSRFGVGLDFGYSETARARFRRETGRVAPFAESVSNANRWDDWRRDRVTEVVRRVGESAQRVNADLEISAAVWAFSDRAYLSIFQDWRRWLEEGLLDFAVPMAYTLDDRLLRYVAHAATGGVAGERVWIGLGTWLFAREPERAREQLQLARAARPAGLAFFSYDAIAEAPALRDALAREAQP